LVPDFGYIHWRREYELDEFIPVYDSAFRLSMGFTKTSLEEITKVLTDDPRSVRVFRLLLGLTGQEFASACAFLPKSNPPFGLSLSSLRSMEAGKTAPLTSIRTAATIVHLGKSGELFPPVEPPLRAKTDKPDTREGWASVQHMAALGVPFSVFLHQRYYGGAFRQLLDSTSTTRGNVLEDEVAMLLTKAGISFVQTGSANQAEISERFGLTVRPAPDFVIYDHLGSLRAMIECKQSNDGGTARDKASRFRSLRDEAHRLGGVPVFAVLSGLGWKRAADALGPVIRDTDGRVFMPGYLPEILRCDPLPGLIEADLT